MHLGYEVGDLEAGGEDNDIVLVLDSGSTNDAILCGFENPPSKEPEVGPVQAIEIARVKDRTLAPQRDIRDNVLSKFG